MNDEALVEQAIDKAQKVIDRMNSKVKLVGKNSEFLEIDKSRVYEAHALFPDVPLEEIAIPALAEYDNVTIYDDSESKAYPKQIDADVSALNGGKFYLHEKLIRRFYGMHTNRLYHVNITGTRFYLYNLTELHKLCKMLCNSPELSFGTNMVLVIDRKTFEHFVNCYITRLRAQRATGLYNFHLIETLHKFMITLYAILDCPFMAQHIDRFIDLHWEYDEEPIFNLRIKTMGAFLVKFEGKYEYLSSEDAGLAETLVDKMEEFIQYLSREDTVELNKNSVNLLELLSVGIRHFTESFHYPSYNDLTNRRISTNYSNSTIVGRMVSGEYITEIGKTKN
jgi:hypothetical protein